MAGGLQVGDELDHHPHVPQPDVADHVERLQLQVVQAVQCKVPGAELDVVHPCLHKIMFYAHPCLTCLGLVECDIFINGLRVLDESKKWELSSASHLLSHLARLHVDIEHVSDQFLQQNIFESHLVLCLSQDIDLGLVSPYDGRAALLKVHHNVSCTTVTKQEVKVVP